MWLGDAGFDEWWFLGESVILRRGAGRFETCPYVRNTTPGRSRTAPTIGPPLSFGHFPHEWGNPGYASDIFPEFLVCLARGKALEFCNGLQSGG